MESPAYPPLPPISSQYRARLRAQLVASFSASEFKLLCADIGVNYDTVPGDEIESRAQGLVARLARRGNLTQLVDYCARMRPHLNWLEQAEEHAQADNLSSWDDIETPAPPKPDHPPVNSAFIGRELELTHYKTQLAELHIAIICGFAGVGKTALAVALAQRVSPAEKVFWHSFHADEGVDVILWRMAGFLGWQGQVELWRMMNSARQSSNSAQPSQVLLDYLIPSLSGHGFLLCLDDYHKVEDDPLMQQLVQRLCSNLVTGRLSLIITSRAMPTFAESALVAPLQGFTATDTRALLVQRGLTLSANLVSELHARTQGNVQFLTLAINALQHTASRERFISRLAEATDIERYLLREIDRNLNPDERNIMSAVAVLLGYSGTRDALDAVLDGGLVRHSLNELHERFLLIMSEGPMGKEFSQHAIVQAFYYDQLGKRERQTMHQHVADFYACEEIDALKAALHYEQAGDVLRAADWATTHLHALINQGQARTVQKLLERLKTRSQDRAEQARITEAHGDIHFLFGEFDIALSDYAMAAQFVDPEDGLAHVRLHRKRGEGLYRQSAFEQSLAAFIQSRMLLAESHDVSPNVAQEAGPLAVGYGSTLLALGRYDEAQVEAQRGLAQLSKETPQPDIEANLYDLLGKVSFYKSDFGESLARFQAALKLRLSISDLRGVIKSHSNVAVVYGQQNRYVEALRENESALEIAEQIGDAVALGMLYNNIASDYGERGAFDKAIEFQERALALSNKMNDLDGLSRSYANLGDIYRRTGNFDQSLNYLSQAINLAEQINSDDAMIMSRTSLAATYFAQGKPIEALTQATNALERAKQTDNLYSTAQCLDLLGRILHAMQKWSEAEAHFEKAAQLQQEQDTYADLAQTLLNWAKMEWDSGRISKANDLCRNCIDVASRNELHDTLSQVRQWQNHSNDVTH